MLGCVLMASGLGRRFGADKLMADFDGSPLISRAIEATDGLFDKRVLLTRSAAAAEYARARGVQVHLHALPRRSDAMRLGLAEMAEMDGCLFCPCDQPLLTREKMVTQESKAGGIIVVGSHTKKTTAQLEELKKVQGIEFIEMDSDKVLVPGELEKEAAAIVAHCSQQIAKGITCCVSTKRVVLTLPDDTPEAALVRSVAISDALQSCVGRLTASPAFVVAKGGITSSDVGVKALRVKCAKVLGQIRPGIPVWQTGAESLFPGTPYIIFPGNVGEVPTLREAVEILLG